MNYRLDIQYDGSRYGGWQRQKDTDNTIQGKIEDVLTKMLGKEIQIQGAGRTDAGVHARGQVANFHADCEKSCEEICQYLNEYLPEDIEISKVSEVEDRFHSRLNAKEKVYQYRIVSGIHKNVLYLEGTYDFKSFCSNKKMKKSSVRTIYSIEIVDLTQEIVITYTGNGFLYNMVRILTGTLIEVGRGRRKPEDMKAILESCDRKDAGFTAPARGLTLLEVRY